MVQAFAVADRQCEVTRSFSKKEYKHDDQTSTPLTLLAATLPLFALSSITPRRAKSAKHIIGLAPKMFDELNWLSGYRPDVHTGDERSESHCKSTFCNAALSDEGSRWLHLSTTAAQ